MSVKPSIVETQALLSLIVRAMVRDRDAVRVNAIAGPGSTTTFQVRVGGSEMGKLIGKQGRVARSLRILLNSIGKEHGNDIALDLVERDGSASGSGL